MKGDFGEAMARKASDLAQGSIQEIFYNTGEDFESEDVFPGRVGYVLKNMAEMPKIDAVAVKGPHNRERFGIADGDFGGELVDVRSVVRDNSVQEEIGTFDDAHIVRELVASERGASVAAERKMKSRDKFGA